MPQTSSELMYSAMLEIFQKAGYEEVASVGVDDKTHQATAFWNPSNNLLYIVYRPFREEDNKFDISSECDKGLAAEMGVELLKVSHAKKVALTIYKNNKCNLSEIDSRVQINDFEQQTPVKVIEDIRQFANKELGFFARYPWIKDVAIGIGIGLAIVGGVAAVISTVGAALVPAVLSFGAAVGFGSGGIAAIVATSFVAGCAAIAVGWGKVFDRKNKQTSVKQNVSANKPQEKVKENISNTSSSSYANILNNIPSDTDKINAAVAFIKANIEFFMAPIANPDVFSVWVYKSQAAMDIKNKIQDSLVLKMIDLDSKHKRTDYAMAYEFRDALFGNESLGPLSGGENSKNKKLILKERMDEIAEKIIADIPDASITRIDITLAITENKFLEPKLAESKVFIELKAEYKELLNKYELYSRAIDQTAQNAQETMPIKGLINDNEAPLRSLLQKNSELVEAILSISNSETEKSAIEGFSKSAVTLGAEANSLRERRLAISEQFEADQARVSDINKFKDAKAREFHRKQQREAELKKAAAKLEEAANNNSAPSMKKTGSNS